MPFKPAIIGLGLSAQDALQLLSAAETRNGLVERPQADFLLIREQAADHGPADIQAHLVASFAAGRIAGIGIVPEVDIFRSDPYLVARSLASLDILSNGRAGIAPLTEPQGQLDIGYASKGHDALYVAEFVEAVRKLWNNWQPGALVRDWKNNRYIDNQLIRRADHHGQYFSVRGPLPTPTAVQPAPVIIARRHPAHELIVSNASAVLGSRQDVGTEAPALFETSLANPEFPAAFQGIVLRSEDGIADWKTLIELSNRALRHLDLPRREDGTTLTERLEAASAIPARGVAHV